MPVVYTCDILFFNIFSAILAFFYLFIAFRSFLCSVYLSFPLCYYMYVTVLIGYPDFIPWSRVTLNVLPHVYTVLSQRVACVHGTSLDFLGNIKEIRRNKHIKGKICMFSYREHQKKYFVAH